MLLGRDRNSPFFDYATGSEIDRNFIQTYTVRMYSIIPAAGQPIPLLASPLALPLADCFVRAGFPSPAGNFQGTRLDIAQLLVQHPQATYLLRVAGLSMKEYGIDEGDLIVVDRALQARHGCIVVAILDNEFTVKFLHQSNGQIRLKAGNRTYPDIVPKEGQTLEIWGVVTACVKRFAK